MITNLHLIAKSVRLADFWAANLFQYLPETLIKKIQLNKIRKILQHSHKNVPFWRGYFQNFGFDPKDFRSWRDLERIPVVTKEQLRKSDMPYWAENADTETTISDVTSGSSGIPLAFYFTTSSLNKRKSIYLRNIFWAGFSGNVQIVRIMTRNISGLSDIGYFVQCRSPTEVKEKKDLIYELLKDKTTILEGVASFIFHLAELMEKDGAHFNIRAAIINSERLERSEILFMESVFSCKVFNCYGAREVDRIAQECDRREGLHVNSDWLYLEIVDDSGKSLPADTSGKIVVTTFENFATPLLRYELGDKGMLLSHQCSCGRKLPLIRFEGRTSEYIILPDGNKIHAFEFTGLFNNLARSILQYQLIQESLNEITVLIIPTKEFTPQDEEKIKSGLLSRTKNFMRVEVRCIDRILTLPSGKKSTLVNKVIMGEHEQMA